MKRKEVYVLNVLLAVILLILTYFIIFGKSGYSEIMTIVGGVDKRYILLAIFVMFLYFLIEAYNIKCLLKSLNENVSLIKVLKARFISFFFSSITPAATGGEPMQVYSLMQDGVSFANGTLASLINICSYQIVIISLAVISFILNFNIVPKQVVILFAIGVSLNFMALCIMMIFIFDKKLAKTLVNFVIKIMTKLKFKNIDNLKEKFNRTLEKYNKQTDYIKSHKKEFIYSIIRTFVDMGIYFIVPYIIYRSFGLTRYDIILFFEIQAILFASVSSIPLPGSIGVSESAFLILYKRIYKEELLRPSLVLTRGINFYLYVLISFVVTLVFLFKGRKKNTNDME